MTKTPEEGLYALVGEASEDAGTSKRDRNIALIAGTAGEVVLGVVKLTGIDVPPVAFGVDAAVTIIIAGMCELGRRISISQSKDFREGARQVVELDMLTKPNEWGATLSEHPNPEPEF